jgi:hypothetical protein
MRGIIATLVLSAPITAFGATNTIGVELGNGHTSGLDCPVTAFNGCATQDDAYRVYYGIQPGGQRFGARITHTELDDLQLTDTPADVVFNAPGIRSRIDDLAATYSYPIADWVSITAKGGLARWEEHRSAFLFDQTHKDGISPALGLNIDFGDRWFRAGLSVDLYPSVGDAGTVRYFGAGVRFVW